MSTLLEKAQSQIIQSRRRTFTKEDLDLVLGWMRDEISTAQLGYALDKRGNYSYYAASVLKWAYDNQLITINKK